MSRKTRSARIVTNSSVLKTIATDGPVLPARGSAVGIPSAAGATVTLAALTAPGDLAVESPGAESGVGAWTPRRWTGNVNDGFTIAPIVPPTTFPVFAAGVYESGVFL